MNAHFVFRLASLLAVCLGGVAGAQEPVFYQPTGAGSGVILTGDNSTLGTGAPLFVGNAADGRPILLNPEVGASVANGAPGDRPLFLTPAAATNPARIGGFVGVGGFGLGVGGAAAGTSGNVSFGFLYLKPLWTYRDFTLVVPRAQAGNFPLFGNTGNVDDHFAFAPTVKLDYDLGPLGISASGTFLNLSGQLQREEAAAGGGTGQLNASSSLTLITANLAEVTKRCIGADLRRADPHHCFNWLDDSLFDVSIGARYSAIDQNHTGSLQDTAGGVTNVSTRYSTQSFKGFGVTGSLGFAKPLSTNLVFFNNARGSVLVGDNIKKSTLTVNLAGVPGVSNTINQTGTSYIPVVEWETGMQWGASLAELLRRGDLRSVVSVRVAMVGQYWGGVGPLSAGSPQGYHRSDMFLVGAHLTVGVAR